MPAPKPIDREWLREAYYEKNLSTRQIAGECGCSDTSVRRYMRMYGFESRTIHEAMLLKDVSGEQNPMWQGGKDPQRRLYQSREWKEARDEAVAQDGCCKRCGATEDLVGHHRKPWYVEETNTAPANVITLCRGCHKAVHNLNDPEYIDLPPIPRLPEDDILDEIFG